MASTHFSWKFPQKLILRVEAFFVLLLAIIVLLISFFHFNRQILITVAMAALFVGVYLFVSQGAKSWLREEHHYEVRGPLLHVTKLKQEKATKDKVHLGRLAHHKLDRFFLGGYLVTRQKKKHLLFFNTPREMKKFENYLQRHLAPVAKK